MACKLCGKNTMHPANATYCKSCALLACNILYALKEAKIIDVILHVVAMHDLDADKPFVL